MPIVETAVILIAKKVLVSSGVKAVAAGAKEVLCEATPQMEKVALQAAQDGGRTLSNEITENAEEIAEGAEGCLEALAEIFF